MAHSITAAERTISKFILEKVNKKSREEELSKLNSDDLLSTGRIAMRKQDDHEHDDSWLANSHGVTLCLQM